MVTEIPWGDGTSDKIYLTYTAASGSQTILVSSDANAGPARTKDITFVSSIGNISRVLTVTQETNMDYVSITWNDTCITYNDTAIAYPYEEDYIVFADPVVEQICATNWGDGVGLKPSQAAKVTNAQFGTTFKDNISITSFNELPYFVGLTALSNNAFSGCSSLEGIALPPLANLPAGIFYNCSSLEEITFNSAVSATAAGTSRFYNTPNFKKIIVCSLSDWFLSAWRETDYYAVSSLEMHLYLQGSALELTSIVVPNNIQSINKYALRRFPNIESITVPATVTTIAEDSFCNLPGLKNFEILSTGTFTPRMLLSTSGIAGNVLGDDTGTFHLCGGLSQTTNIATAAHFKKIIIDGDVSYTHTTGGMLVTQDNPIQIIKIGGDAHFGYAAVSSVNLEFFEVGGTVSGQLLGTKCSNVIVHLSYEGVACSPSSIYINTHSRCSKIYVGDGSSGTHDSAILSQYQTGWSGDTTALSKLDTWYNYINNPNANPDYIN